MYNDVDSMRKITLGLILLFLIGSLGFLLMHLLRESGYPPTPVGWRANVQTIAGDGASAFRDASQPLAAGFSDPFGIAIGPDGTIYVSDAGESNRIRKLALEGTVTTLAGGIEGYADGPGQSASFNSPSGLALDSNGNLYVADTGNNRIRKITPEGLVSTVAGDGTAGHRDGLAAQAWFDGPIGIALDDDGNIYVADTYNDRIRLITNDGQVTTIAGMGRPGHADGERTSALFDTPCGIAVMEDKALIVADTGNNGLRKIAPDGQVTTLSISFPGEESPGDLRKPVALALTHDGFLYVTEFDRARVVQIAPDGAARVIAGGNPGFADGLEAARLNHPAGMAISKEGDLYVADSANYLVRRLGQSINNQALSRLSGPLPQLSNTTLGRETFLWPFDPQEHPHEIVATMGEVRGSYDSTDSRERLHSGVDVFGAYDKVVRVIRSEKVTSPLANWDLGGLNEGIRVGVISYIHMHVGRDKDGKVFDDPRFIPVQDEEGKLSRIRVRRGTRFRPGDAIGTVNRMYHIHLNVGPPGAEINFLSLSPIGFSDRVAPRIERDGIQLFDETGTRLTEQESGRLVVSGRVRIVVEAFDRNEMNSSRRKLGLYRLGYQVLQSDSESDSEQPATGFEQPRITIEFNRLPGGREAPKLTYAEESGITVYGSKTTRFLYEVTNTVRDGRAVPGLWDTSELPSGDYTLRIIGADYSGNEAQEGRDVLIRVK